MTKLAGTVVLLIAITAAGCAGPATPAAPQAGQEAKPVYGGTLNLHVRNDPPDWDPNGQGAGAPGYYGLAQAYNSLLGFEKGPDIDYAKMVLRPELAERWEVSNGGRTVTFHLRKGVKFANLPPVSGRELTAADVKWTAEYYTRSGEFKDKKLPESRRLFMYQGLDKVETQGPYTVQFHFTEPFAPFLPYAASDLNPIVAREIFEAEGSHKDGIIGTGPFQRDAQASQPGTRWVFKKNASYWEEGKPYLDEIRWIVILDDAAALPAFQTKQLDVMYNLPPDQANEIRRANPAAQVSKYLQPHAANLRVSQAPGTVTARDVRVGRAISLGLDRDEINKVFAGGEGTWALAGAMSGLFTEAEAKQLYKYDPEAAKRLLVEAGYPNGVTLELPTDTSRSQSEITLYQLMQAQLKKVGVTVDWKPMDQALQRQKRIAGDFGLDATTGVLPLEADNDSILYAEYHSSLHRSTNYSKVNDPELDRILEAGRREMDPEKRRELLRDAVRRIADRVYMVGLVYTPKHDTVQPYVKGYYPHFSDRGSHLFSWLQK